MKSVAGSEAMAVSLRHSAFIWLLLSVTVFVLDWWTKELALSALVPYQPQVFIEGFWNWTLVYNPGAAFSFLSDAGGWQRWFFGALAVGISALLTYWLTRIPRNDWRQALPYSLVIGGALGNMVDRIRHGHVIDFVDWHWRGWHWPAFNIADAAIVGGAIGLILFGMLFPARSAGK